MFPLLPTQLTKAKFTIVNLKTPAKTQAKLVYYSFTKVNLTFTIVKHVSGASTNEP